MSSSSVSDSIDSNDRSSCTLHYEGDVPDSTCSWRHDLCCRPITTHCSIASTRFITACICTSPQLHISTNGTYPSPNLLFLLQSTPRLLLVQRRTRRLQQTPILPLSTTMVPLTHHPSPRFHPNLHLWPWLLANQTLKMESFPHRRT